MARPRKRKGEIIDGLKQAFRSDCNVLTACNWVGISKSTYYSWLKIDRRFNDEMDVCRRLHAEGRTMTEEEEIEEHHRKDMQKAMKCLRNKRIREGKIKGVESDIEEEDEEEIVDYYSYQYKKPSWNCHDTSTERMYDPDTLEIVDYRDRAYTHHDVFGKVMCGPDGKLIH